MAMTNRFRPETPARRSIGLALGVLAVFAAGCGDQPPLEPGITSGNVAVWSHAGHAGHAGAALVGWWRFDEGAGPVLDESSLGNHGQLTGAAAYTANALLGYAVDFTGATGLVTVPHDDSLEPATGTIQVWIKVPALKDADVVAKVTSCMVRRDPDCSSTGGSVIGLRIEEDGGVNAFIANDDPDAGGPWTFAGVAADAIVPDTWHHLAMRWNGAVLTLFIDGLPVAMSAYDPVPGMGLSYRNGSPFWLGAATSWGAGHPGDREYIGQIDDVRFYAAARTDVAIFTDFVTKGHKPATP
jgi:hypothetical protein